MKEPPIISLSIKDRSVRDMLVKLAGKTQNLSPALKECGEYLLVSTDDRWEQQIDPNGIPWKPNSPYTIALKKSQGRLLKILQSTGAGRSSIRYQIKNNTLTVGTNLGYMKDHQLGIGVPKREFLGITVRDRQEVNEIIQEHLRP